MSSPFRIDYVEAALLLLLNANLAAAYGAKVNIDSLGDKDFDDDGRLILQPPSVRVRFAGADYKNLHDNQRLSYQGAVPFEILCFESSLRSRADERKQTLVLVATVQDQLAGARLALADSTQSMPIAMQSVKLVSTDEGPVDQLFSIVITVEGIAQFSGANARPGA
jgi:phage gp37-like protein